MAAKTAGSLKSAVKGYPAERQTTGSRQSSGELAHSLSHGRLCGFTGGGYRGEGGVRLDFVARENLFFNQVLIQGLISPPSEASAAAATQLDLGQTYLPALVEEAAERLRETVDRKVYTPQS